MAQNQIRNTRLSQNPNYGRPSGAKQSERERGWRLWAQGMAFLRQVHAEVKSELDTLQRATDMLDNSTKI